MPLIKGGATRVLSAQAHRNPLLHQTRKGERLSHAVVERLLARPHLLALFEQLLYLRMDVEALRDRWSSAR